MCLLWSRVWLILPTERTKGKTNPEQGAPHPASGDGKNHRAWFKEPAAFSWKILFGELVPSSERALSSWCFLLLLHFKSFLHFKS